MYIVPFIYPLALLLQAAILTYSKARKYLHTPGRVFHLTAPILV